MTDAGVPIRQRNPWEQELTTPTALHAALGEGPRPEAGRTQALVSLRKLAKICTAFNRLTEADRGQDQEGGRREGGKAAADVLDPGQTGIPTILWSIQEMLVIDQEMLEAGEQHRADAVL